MLDFPATGQALWALYDETGIRPEYALAVFWLESKFNPSIVNPIGCVGLFQLCPQSHTLPSGYASWPASQQISESATPFWAGIVKQYGEIRSGTRLMQGNWLPGTLVTARRLSSVVAAAPSPSYTQNATVFDPKGKGYSTVQDVANAIAKTVPFIQDAIAQTYALRPTERPRDPVYGDDFPRFPWPALAASVVVVGVGAFLAYDLVHER